MGDFAPPVHESTFGQVLQMNPGYWQALGNLAEIYDRSGRPAEARSAYQRVLQQNSADAQARQWLATH